MSDERVRLFVALELPSAVRRELIRWREAAFADDPALRMIDGDALHATLCFLGWRDATELDAIAAACTVVSGGGELPLALAEALWLPRRRPRVLAVRLEDRRRALARLQAELSDALARGGWYRPEARPFLAHVTVARVGRGARAPTAGAATPPALGFSAGAVTLFRSRLGGSAARYEKLRTISLLSDPES